MVLSQSLQGSKVIYAKGKQMYHLKMTKSIWYEIQHQTLSQILLQADSRPGHQVWVLAPFDPTQATQTTDDLSMPFLTGYS